MELKDTAVSIVSIFGRGHWLATELARKGIPVSLIDVSDSMGNWPAEDWEGPFGFFKNEKLLASQLERLIEDQEVQENAQGFSIWLESGPLEMKGPLTQHRLGERWVLLKHPAHVDDVIIDFASKLCNLVLVPDAALADFEKTST